MKITHLLAVIILMMLFAIPAFAFDQYEDEDVKPMLPAYNTVKCFEGNSISSAQTKVNNFIINNSVTIQEISSPTVVLLDRSKPVICLTIGSSRPV